MEYGLDVGGISPRAICVEVVQTILDLTESYAKLFTLRQTPCFIPYFVFAAGLTRIAFGVDARTTQSRETSLESDVADGIRDMYMGGADDGQSSRPPPGPITNNSDALSRGEEADGRLTQAVSQLDTMSCGHAAASQAGWVLRDFKLDQAGLH